MRKERKEGRRKEGEEEKKEEGGREGELEYLGYLSSIAFRIRVGTDSYWIMLFDYQGKSRTWPFFFLVKPSIYISSAESVYPLAFLKLFIISYLVSLETLHYTNGNHTYLPSFLP